LLIDLNVHSRLSVGGVLEPEEILLRAKSEGLDGVCFTEDQPFTEWRELKELGKDHDVTVLVGREIVTSDGHFLFFPKNPESVEPGKFFDTPSEDDELPSYNDLRRLVGKEGGVLVPAHPYRRVEQSMGDRIFRCEGIKAIETRNATCSSLMNDFALEASLLLKLPGIAGSDTRENLGTLGSVATLFRTPVRSQEDLLNAIENGELWSVELFGEDRLHELQSSANHYQGRQDRRGGRGGDRRSHGDRRGGGRDDRRGGGRRDDRRGGGGRRDDRDRSSRGGGGRRDDRRGGGGRRDDRRGGGNDRRGGGGGRRGNSRGRRF